MDYIGFYSKHVEDLKKEGRQYKGWCPFHLAKGSERKGFSVNPDNGLWFCFSCGKKGNAITFCKEKEISIKKSPDYDPNYYKYVYPDGAVKKKHKKEKRSFWEKTEGKMPSTPYNDMAVNLARKQKKSLWICEGEKDTETMWIAGEMAIGRPSASSYKVLDGISLIDIPKVYIAFDNDESGKKATAKALSRFPFALAVHWPKEMPEHFDVTNLRYKDPNFVQILKLWAVDTDPYPPETKRLKEKFDRDMSRDPDKLLGYELKKFSNLAKNIDGIQPGFYVVGAETNAGKTAFLCNMTLDLLDSNEGLTGIYFSLNDSWDVISNRFLSIRTGISLNLVQRPQKKHRHEEMLKDGYNYLTELMTENRLFIRDSSDIENIMDLEIEIRRKMNRKLFVVIDSLYNLEMNLDGGDQRRENIERANRLKALSNTYGIPLMCTGELRKSKDRRDGNKPPIIDDLMETGKFAYNANLVLLLYPESWDAYDQEDEPILIMKYAKNKLSHFRGGTSLKFNRATSRLFENEERQELFQTIPV